MPISSNGFLLFLLYFMILPSHSSSSSSPVRPDPLLRFKSYNGGFNLTSRHYWASVSFTGVHGYAIACIWILVGVGIGIYAIVRNINPSASSSSPVSTRQHSNSYYLVPFLVILLCTFLAIVASSFVIAANHNSLLRTKKLETTFLRVGRVALERIRKVTRAMSKMRRLLTSYNVAACNQLRSTSRKLAKASRVIRSVVYTHRHSIDTYIKIWYGTIAGVASVNLVLVVAALVVLLLNWRPGFLMIICLCWFITTVCWILTGFQFFLHNFADDTCFAFEEFQQNPANNSLSNMFPCVGEVYADQIMIDIGSTVHQFINKLNSNIETLSELLGLDGQGGNSVSATKFFKICNPFSDAPNYIYNLSSCPKDAIQISDIPNMLAKFTCDSEQPNLTCVADGKFISKSSSEMVLDYSQTIQEFLNVLPDIDNLAHCSFIKDTISDILMHQCRSFRISFKVLWLSVLGLSCIIVILELLWLAKLYQSKGRNFHWCSVIPS